METHLVTAHIDDVHREIARSAAAIANRDERLIGLLPGLHGDVFREAVNQSQRGGLAIAFVEGLEYASDEVVAKLHQIGREAIHQAIYENQDLFVGAIVGEAREGRNYFNRFVGPDEQMKLF